MKLIFFYRSNAHKELAYYGKLTKKLSVRELLAAVRTAIADSYNDDEEENELLRATSDETIPFDDVTVVIETLSIEQIININHHIIVDSLGNIPEDDFDDLTDNEIHVSNSNSNDSNNEVVGRGVLDFSNDDLLEEFGEPN